MSISRAAGLGLRGQWIGAIYLVLTVVVLVPVFSVQMPCLGDYVNHLARIAILARIDQTPALQVYYDTAWKFVPYYGMDVTCLMLTHVMSVYAAGRVFVALCVMMPVVACAVLRRTVYGRIGFMPALAFLVSYNYTLDRGFLNYLFSGGLAIMLFAGWVAAAQWHRWIRAGVFAVGALVLYAAHPFAFLIYGILTGGYEINQAYLSEGSRLRRRAAALSLAAVQAVPVIILILWLGVGAHGSPGAVSTTYGSLVERIAALASPLYFPGNGFVVAACLLVPLAGICVLPWVRVARGFHLGLLGLLAAACCIPTVLSNAWGADLRLPLVVIIVILAVSRPVWSVTPGAKSAILIIVALLTVMRAAGAFVLLRGLDAQAADIRRVVQGLPIGARLLVAEAGDDAPGRIAPPVMTAHIGMVAAIDRAVFVPMLFTEVVPIEVRPAYRRAASPNVPAVTVAQLWSGLQERDGLDDAPAYGYGGHVYWRDWAHKYDYVLFVHFGASGTALPGILHLMARSTVADLYRIGGGAG